MSKTTTQINVKDIPVETLKQAKKKAIDEGRSLSDVLRELLQVWATGEKDKKPQPTK